MVIDGAENCVYDVFAALDEDSVHIPGRDGHRVHRRYERRQDSDRVFDALKRIWSNRIPKREALSIHGIVFYQLYGKRKYFQTLRDEEAVNPDGSALR